MTRVYRIPTPPSVNNLYINVRGRRRVLSPKYRNWKAEARQVLLAQRPDKVPGKVIILLSVPRVTGADIDNRSKAALDLLVECDVIEDDRNVAAVLSSWGVPGDSFAYVGIVPSRALTAQFHPTEDRAGGGWFIDGAPLGEMNDGVVAS